jgi:hypothetical protein
MAPWVVGVIALVLVIGAVMFFSSNRSSTIPTTPTPVLTGPEPLQPDPSTTYPSDLTRTQWEPLATPTPVLLDAVPSQPDPGTDRVTATTNGRVPVTLPPNPYPPANLQMPPSPPKY